MELMDQLSIEAAEASVHAGFPLDAGAALVVELDGSEHECDAGFEEVQQICERGGATGVRVAKDDADRASIWKTRKAAFAAMGRLSPNYYVQDSVVPRTRLAHVLHRIGELSEERGLRVANVFHAGDGNLHPLVLFNAANEGEAERAEELAGLIVKACVAEGGSITGEHGVGIDKKRYMPEQFAEPDLAAFQKLALDPPDPGGATIGGIVATGDSGPLRHRYGAARDLVVGVTVALPDGTVAHAGGKVIKNVAGYDLAKLFAGSFGTLGAIVEVAVRLHPVRPTASAGGQSDRPEAAANAAIELAPSQREARARRI